MPTLPVLRIRGLFTGDNLLGVPDGALVKADNVVVPAQDELEPRPGQRYEGTAFGSGSSRARAIAFYRSGKVVLYGTTLAFNTTVDGAYTDNSGSYTEADATLLRMKFVEMGENLYFNTSLGLYVKESLSATPVAAGILKSPANTPTTGAQASAYGPAGSWLTSDRAAAYAHVWGRKDANNNVKLGAPSDVQVASNPILSVAIGGLVRTAAGGLWPAGKVTVTVTGPLQTFRPWVGDTFTLAAGEANFPAGVKTVVTVTATGFTYDEAGANVASTVAQTLSGSCGALVRASIPSGITGTNGDFVRFYRSLSVAGAANVPGLDMFQIYEVTPSAGDVATGYVQFLDGTPDIMLAGAPPLYTSPNFGDGALAAKERPPLAKDIFEFDGRMWFLNTTSRHRFFLNLLGVYQASPDTGVQNNDTITIAGQTYTFKTSAGVGQVQLYTSGSVAQNIEATARYLAGIINANGSNTTVNAFYVSGVDDAPGRLLIEERAIGGSAFAVAASRSTAWFPALPTSGSTITSDNSRRPHGLSYSPVGEPEAVPLTNYVDGIPRGREAIRGIALRDKAYVLVKNVGIFLLSGPAPYRLTKLDTTAKPLVPDTFVEHNNMLLGLTDQGVVAISEGGVRILSSPIESELLELVLKYLANVKLRGFAVSNEAARQYQLWLPDDGSDTSAVFAWVYNSLRDCWTKWTGNRTCGGVNPEDGLLCLGDGSTDKLRIERRTFLVGDCADETYSVTVNSVTATGYVLASAVGVSVGDVIIDTFGYLITAINGTTVTVVGTPDAKSTGSKTVYKGIPVDVKFAPPRTSDPAILKQFREVSFHFSKLSAYALTSYFDSEKGHVETTGKTLRASDFTSAGTSSAKSLLSANKRAEVPIQHQRSTQLQVGLRITEALSRWRLNGYSLTYEPLTEKSED